MSKRERLLAMGVGVVALLVGTQWGITRISKGFQSKQETIVKLKADFDKNEISELEGIKAEQRIKKLVATSLPRNLELAVSQYSAWLNDLARDVGLSKPSIKSEPGIRKGDTDGIINPKTNKSEKMPVYQALKFVIKGTGTIEQMVDLLYRFYDMNYLHRVSEMQVVLTGQPYQLNLTMTIECLMLEAASPTQPIATTPADRFAMSKQEYIDAIVGRNIFSPANHPPVLRPTATASFYANAPIDYDFRATDPDSHSVTIELIDGAPRGLRVNNGKLVGMVREIGEFEVNVRASDSGIPSKSADQLLKITINPPAIAEPKAPKFDIATQARITAFTTNSKGEPQVFISSRIENKDYMLKIGDELVLGDVKGKVIAIGRNYADFETDGKKWTCTFDDSLADGYRRKDK